MHLLAALLAAALAGLTAAVARGSVVQLDRSAAALIQRQAPPWLEAPAGSIARVDALPVTAALAVVFAVFLLGRGRRLGALAPLLVLLAVPVTRGLGVIVGRHPLDAVATAGAGSSFPSLLVAFTGFVGVFLAGYLGGRGGLTLVVWLVVVLAIAGAGASQVIVGRAWPSDVAAGLLLGLLFATLSHLFLSFAGPRFVVPERQRTPRRRTTRRRTS